MSSKRLCDGCKVEFEPKTPLVDTEGNGVYHLGCFAKRVQSRKKQKCSHYTPAEDQSPWAYAHRTYGCPDEGAVWPDLRRGGD